jgi:hypothetical protein
VLERALDNLLRNAVRFNPPGQSIELSARNEDDTLFISVRDHGPGVSAEHLAQLGEPFYRAPNQTRAGLRPGSGDRQARSGKTWGQSDAGKSSAGRVHRQHRGAAGYKLLPNGLKITSYSLKRHRRCGRELAREWVISATEILNDTPLLRASSLPQAEQRHLDRISPAIH